MAHAKLLLATIVSQPWPKHSICYKSPFVLFTICAIENHYKDDVQNGKMEATASME